MLTYIIRRLLYSTVVLVLASFLVFTFVTVSGDPLAGLRIAPNVSPLTVQNVIDRKHLDDPVPKRYLYWVQDAVTNQFGSTLLDNRPILPELWRVMKNTLQLVLIAQILVVFFAVLIGVYSAIRQYSGFDYTMTTFSFLGLATPVFWLALMAQVAVVQIYERTGHRLFPIANLNSVDPGHRDPFLDRPRAPSRAARARAHGRRDRRLLALHARRHARGDQLRLRAHGARQGPERAQGDDEARAPERADPARHARRARFRHAARRRRRHRDRVLARRDGPLLRECDSSATTRIP